MRRLRRCGRWISRQTKDRPFFSALVLLMIVTVPGYLRLESAVNKANEAAERITVINDAEAARDAATILANCQIRNNASKNGRERFDTFFTGIERIFTSNPGQTAEQRERAVQFVNSLRAEVPLDAEAEDVDCNKDGKLDESDYG